MKIPPSFAEARKVEEERQEYKWQESSSAPGVVMPGALCYNEGKRGEGQRVGPEIQEKFYEPLKGMSVYGLAIWFRGFRSLVKDGDTHKEDLDKMAFLADCWERVLHLKKPFPEKYFPLSEDPIAPFPEEARERLLENKAVLSGQNFRLARLALARDFPHYWLKPGKRDGYICLDDRIYKECYGTNASITKMVQRNVRRFAAQYKEALDEAIVFPKSERYREKMDGLFPLAQKSCHIVFSDTDIKSARQYDSLSLKELAIEILSGKADVTYEAPNTKKRLISSGEHRLIDYGITPQGKKNYINGVYVEKPFMVRLAFYLGLDGGYAETLLKKEGYTLKGSVRKWDRILYEALKFSWDTEMVDTILKKDKFKPLFGKA